MSTKATFAMLFANEVWAVYGIGIQGGDACVGCAAAPMGEAAKRDETAILSGSPAPSASLAQSASRAAANSMIDTDHPSATEIVPFNTPPPTGPLSSPTLTLSTTSPAPTPSPPTNQLETGVKIGIATLSAILTLALLVFLLETCYLRRRRREKALQRAVQEVESGERTERALAELKDSQQIVVLESRISIVFDEGSEVSEGSEDEVEEWEGERGRARNGMSLARREY